MNKTLISAAIFILISTGIVYLVFFNKHAHVSAEDVTKWFSEQLTDISENLQHDILRDQQGKYPHSDSDSFEARGMITYTLIDKKQLRFDISEHNTITMLDIMSTNGYRLLDNKVNELDLSIRLKQHQIEDNEVDDKFSQDEYVFATRRYYTVTIGGWNI